MYSIVPVLANGDIFTMTDALRFREQADCSALLIARGALYNPSIFRVPDNLADPFEVARNYVRVCVSLDNHFANTKYTVVRILGEKCGADPRFLSLQQAKTYQDVLHVLELEDSLWTERETLMPFKLDSLTKLLGPSVDSRIPEPPVATADVSTGVVEDAADEHVVAQSSSESASQGALGDEEGNTVEERAEQEQVKRLRVA
jgi:hypothetical protein